MVSAWLATEEAAGGNHTLVPLLEQKREKKEPYCAFFNASQQQLLLLILTFKNNLGVPDDRRPGLRAWTFRSSSDNACAEQLPRQDV